MHVITAALALTPGFHSGERADAVKEREAERRAERRERRRERRHGK
jgi:hypothetical protein